MLDAVIENAQSIASLDVVIDSESGSQLGDMIASHDQSLEDAEEQDARWRQAEQLRGLISKLGRRDRNALAWAWGLDGYELSRRELCARLRMSGRKLTGYLQGLEEQLRGMAVQLVLVAVVAVPVQRLPRVSRRRRERVPAGQLVLRLEDLSPTENDADRAPCA